MWHHRTRPPAEIRQGDYFASRRNSSGGYSSKELSCIAKHSDEIFVYDRRVDALRRAQYLYLSTDAALCFARIKVDWFADMKSGKQCFDCCSPLSESVWIALLNDGRAHGPLCDSCANNVVTTSL